MSLKYQPPIMGLARKMESKTKFSTIVIALGGALVRAIYVISSIDKEKSKSAPKWILSWKQELLQPSYLLAFFFLSSVAICSHRSSGRSSGKSSGTSPERVILRILKLKGHSQKNHAKTKKKLGLQLQRITILCASIVYNMHNVMYTCVAKLVRTLNTCSLFLHMQICRIQISLQHHTMAPELVIIMTLLQLCTFQRWLAYRKPAFAHAHKKHMRIRGIILFVPQKP